MKTIFISFTLIFYIGFVYAQNSNYAFGKLTQAEFNMIEYEVDPDAEAVVLFDIGLSEFIDYNNSYLIQFTRTRRIKVFDQAGLESAEITIPIYHDDWRSEIVESIEAYSYNYENSQLTKKELDQSSVYEEVISENWKGKKFVIPDVKEGTIFEYKYVITSPFHFNLPDWKFQDKIPTIYSRYTVHMIPFYEYIFLVQGTNQFSYQNSEVDKGLTRRFGAVEFNDMVHTYIMKDIPAFKDESYMTSIEDYIMKMDFQLAKFTDLSGVTTEVISTWDKLKDTYQKHPDFGKYIRKNQKLAETILKTELNLDNLTEEQKVETIVNYVKKSFRWNGYNATFASKPAKDMINEKNGNAADINLFLITMLQKAGIKALPVLISTRSHGKVGYDYPFSHFFNYVIVLTEVDGKSLLTDGTEVNLGFNRIPIRCMNEKGLLIQEGDVRWINLNSNLLSKSIFDIELNIDPEQDVASTSVVAQSTEYESYNLKEKFENDSAKYVHFLHENGFSLISNMKFKNYENPEKIYYYSFKGEVQIEKLDDNIIVKPFINIPPAENSLTMKERNYPVDFAYPKSVKLKTKITIPENYILVDHPDKIKIENDLATLILQYDLNENKLTLDGEYTFKQSVYQPNQYDKVKYFMKYIVKLFNTPVVLKKNQT